MNSRKEKVSKVILLAGFVCAQALLGPARSPQVPAVLIAGPSTIQDPADVSTNCARAPRELRFEMITADTEVHPQVARQAVVCLAVYQPGTD